MQTTIPVTPDAPTAREWAVEELAKPEYHNDGASWIARLFDWIGRQIENLMGAGPAVGGGGVILTVLVILAVLALLTWLVVGPLRRSRRRKRTHSVFEDDTRSSTEMKSAAQSAAERGDWNTAVMEMYRVTVRSLEEREILDDRPGVTAHEAAVETSAKFPDVAAAMLADADVFDGVRYGHYQANREHYEHARSTNARLVGRSLLQAAAP